MLQCGCTVNCRTAEMESFHIGAKGKHVIRSTANHLRYWPACGKYVFYRPNTITSPSWMRDSTPVVQPQSCRPARSQMKIWLIIRDILGVIMQTQSHAARDQKEKSAKGWKKQSLSQAETISFSVMLLLL